MWVLLQKALFRSLSWEALAREAEREGFSRLLSWRTFSLTGTIIFSICPSSLTGGRAVSCQWGFGNDAVHSSSAASLQPEVALYVASSRSLPCFGLVFTLQVWVLVSAAPNSSPAQGWLIWGLDLETLKRKIRREIKPTPSALGIDFFWSLGKLEIRPWEISVVWT